MDKMLQPKYKFSNRNSELENNQKQLINNFYTPSLLKIIVSKQFP